MQTSAQQGDMRPLTEKDLAYMHDIMSWELLAAKKAYQYAHQTLEPDCRQLMFQVAQQHQRNMEQIMQHLGQHVSMTIQANVAGAQPVAAHMPQMNMGQASKGQPNMAQK